MENKTVKERVQGERKEKKIRQIIFKVLFIFFDLTIFRCVLEEENKKNEMNKKYRRTKSTSCYSNNYFYWRCHLDNSLRHHLSYCSIVSRFLFFEVVVVVFIVFFSFFLYFSFLLCDTDCFCCMCHEVKEIRQYCSYTSVDLKHKRLRAADKVHFFPTAISIKFIRKPN